MSNPAGEVVDRSNPASIHDEDRLADKREILKPTKLKILQQLLANEWGCLSAREVAYRNDSIEESTIRDHLRELESRSPPLVRKLNVKEGYRKRGIPWTFFAVSEYGLELLKEVGAYDGVTVLYQMYDNMDRSSLREIEEFQHRPTPDWL